MTKILHFSDIHIQVPFEEMPKTQLLNKRALALLNLALRRGKRFKEAKHKLNKLVEFANEQSVNFTICSGDLTAMGLEPELISAKQSLSPFFSSPRGFMVVPGNHDLYLSDATQDQRFERIFQEQLKSDFPEYAVDGVWPMIKNIDDDTVVIGVNSARPNPQPWRSSGRIPPSQLEALGKIIQSPLFHNRFIFLVTHYAPRISNGQPDSKHHGLENADDLLHMSRRIKNGAILFGHVHQNFHVKVAETSCPLFGAGSATEKGHEGFWLYEIENGKNLKAFPGIWDGKRYALHPSILIRYDLNNSLKNRFLNRARSLTDSRL